MVGKEVVEGNSELSTLQEGAGEIGPLKPKENFERLPHLARHLTRLRPSYGVTVRRHISDLIEQCGNYERGNKYLARRMIETMERIEERTNGRE